MPLQPWEQLGEELEPLLVAFRLLSDKTRLRLLLLLSEGERNVTDLCDELNLPQPTVSHHLGLMRMSNVVEFRRQGKQVFYSISSRYGPTTAANDLLQVHLKGYTISIITNE